MNVEELNPVILKTSIIKFRSYCNVAGEGGGSLTK